MTQIVWLDLSFVRISLWKGLYRPTKNPAVSPEGKEYVLPSTFLGATAMLLLKHKHKKDPVSWPHT
jgi:hypothetical protein